MAKVKVAKQGEFKLVLKYPASFATNGADFTPVSLSFMEWRGRSWREIWYFKNFESEECVKAVVSRYYLDEIGPVWNRMAMKMLKSVSTRAIPYGEDDTPMIRKNDYVVSFLFTYVRNEGTVDGTTARLIEFAEYIKLAMIQTEDHGGVSVNKFLQLFQSMVSPNLVNMLPERLEQNLNEMQVEIESIDTLDAIYMDNQINSALRYCFRKKDLSGEENIPIVALGWKNPGGRF